MMEPKTYKAWGPLRWILLATGSGAITLPPLGVFVRPDMYTERTPAFLKDLLQHENGHWAQYQRMGLFTFYGKYLWYTLRYGYTANPMEVEARQIAAGES